MNMLILLAAALLPAVLLGFYILKQDAQPEPTNWLVKAVFYGMAICIPVAMFELVIEHVVFGGEINTLTGSVMQAFFVAALPEESFKLLALWLLLRHNPWFDEHFDGIVYAVCIGLGFAAVENVLYVVSSEDNWLSVAVMRALLAVPGHYAFAVLMGYYYSIYHFVDHSSSVALRILLVPVVGHGIYDALALSGAIDAVSGGILFIALIYFCVKMHKFARKKIVELVERDRQQGIGSESPYSSCDENQ